MDNTMELISHGMDISFSLMAYGVQWQAKTIC